MRLEVTELVRPAKSPPELVGSTLLPASCSHTLDPLPGARADYSLPSVSAFPGLFFSSRQLLAGLCLSSASLQTCPSRGYQQNHHFFPGPSRWTSPPCPHLSATFVPLILPVTFRALVSLDVYLLLQTGPCPHPTQAWSRAGGRKEGPGGSPHHSPPAEPWPGGTDVSGIPAALRGCPEADIGLAFDPGDSPAIGSLLGVEEEPALL